MNQEKIKELAKQANMEYNVFLPDAWTGTSEDLERFAELIVDECAKICEYENVSMLDVKVILESSKKQIQDLATKSCGENLAKRMKEHFKIDVESKLESLPKCSVCGTTNNVRYMGGHQPWLCYSPDCIPF